VWDSEKEYGNWHEIMIVSNNYHACQRIILQRRLSCTLVPPKAQLSGKSGFEVFHLQ